MIMKKFRLIVFFPFLLLSGQLPSDPQLSEPALLEVFQRIDQEVSAHSEAYFRLGESIDRIGHRLTGSENGAKAEQYAYDLLKSYGFSDVRFQPFEMNGWIREEMQLNIRTAAGGLSAVKAVALALTPARADLDGVLVDMGNGLEADYLAAPEKARGKIVLAALNILPGSPDGTRNIHRSAKVTLAIEYGAKGIILFNSVTGGTLLTGTASIDGTLLPVPAIAIGLEDGMALKEQVAAGEVSAQIRMRNKTGQFTARNVIVRIEGSELPEETIVVGGHLDSWDLSPGAVDNGLGSFSVIDMARTFISLGLKPKRSVEFVLFMGEEQGLLGSKAYVRQAAKTGALDRIRFMLNFDMTNDPRFFTATLEGSRPLFESISKTVMQVDTSFQNRFSARAGLYSDHQPFMLQGIPTGGAGGGRLSREALNCYHADCDVFSLVNDQEMRNTVRFGAMLAYGLAEATSIPVTRLSDQAVKQLMLDNNLEESLRIGGDWRW